MKRPILLYLATLILLAACSSTGVSGGAFGCKASGEFTFNVNANKPRASPRNRCTDPGASMVIKIRPDKFNLNEVSTFAKTTNPDGGGLNNWLTASNDVVKGEIRILVPPASYFSKHCSSYPAKDCVFEYGILAKGRPVVDPKVTVRK